MEKFEFSPKGVAALCHHLYQLNDTELAIEATAIEVDFKAWTAQHFALDESQLFYLNNLPFEVNRFLAFQTSFAVGHRLTIILVKPEHAGVRASKLFKPKADLSMALGPDDGYTANGELLLNISYG